MLLELYLGVFLHSSAELYDAMSEKMLYIKADQVKIVYHDDKNKKEKKK